MNRRNILKSILPLGLGSSFILPPIASNSLAVNIHNDFLDSIFQQLDKRSSRYIIDNKSTTIYSETNGYPENKFRVFFDGDEDIDYGYHQVKFWLTEAEETYILNRFKEKYNLKIDRLPRIDRFINLNNQKIDINYYNKYLIFDPYYFKRSKVLL